MSNKLMKQTNKKSPTNFFKKELNASFINAKQFQIIKKRKQKTITKWGKRNIIK